MTGVMGTLKLEPAISRLDLLAAPVAAALEVWPADAPIDGDQVLVAPIDATLADTAAFCEAYDVSLAEAANCVIVAGKRGDVTRYAACVVLATTRADVNGVVRRHLDARKASFAPMDEAVRLSGMEYGGITPIGLPKDWPVLVDARVVAMPHVIIGSGVRHSKIAIAGPALGALPEAQVIEGLAREA
jgi:prolyl-tRNA editing enzyme YbaK/EbsC (Cys-tRNA(Pro) deacylase)